LSIGGQVYGNLAVDAFKFVYISPEPVIVTPTPEPTPVPWTNHPPSPEEQMTSGDLAARLGLVQRWYVFTPVVGLWEETTFDDCQAFPRDGCGGTREGWQLRVEYQARNGMAVTYRLARDRQHVALDAPEALKNHQILYLSGFQAMRFFYVYRYPDGTWQFVNGSGSGSASSGPIDAQALAALLPLVDRYGSIGTTTQRVVTADGWELRLYGLGSRVELSADDRAALEALGAELGRAVLP
jgi:hypothetical protein